MFVSWPNFCSVRDDLVNSGELVFTLQKVAQEREKAVGSDLNGILHINDQV